MNRLLHTALLWLLIALAVIPSTGCLGVKRGDTILHVNAADLEEEKAIRRQLWRVERAVELVRLRYGLEDIAVEVDIMELGGLGQTAPALSHLSVSGARFSLNKRVLLEDHPDLDDIMLGLAAHELAHALHYARMSRADLIELGIKYGSALKHPDGPDREWVRAYERLTDMTAIALGFDESLVHQKWASEANLAANHPPHVWDFYLHESEILELAADRTLLLSTMAEMLAVLELPSLAAFQEHEAFDEVGDLDTAR